MAAQESLSVVLPVHNAAETLANSVVHLLEILPDLTPRFEVLIVDDGSLDQTAEIAHELARIYPQVLVAKHVERSGRTAIVETALARTTGDILLIQDENLPIDSSKFVRLWALRDSERMVVPLSKLRRRPSLARQVAAWGLRLEDSAGGDKPGGLQMIRRSPGIPEPIPAEALAPMLHRRIDVQSNTSSATTPQFTTLRK